MQWIIIGNIQKQWIHYAVHSYLACEPFTLYRVCWRLVFMLPYNLLMCECGMSQQIYYNTFQQFIKDVWLLFDFLSILLPHVASVMIISGLCAGQVIFGSVRQLLYIPDRFSRHGLYVCTHHHHVGRWISTEMRHVPEGMAWWMRKLCSCS